MANIRELKKQKRIQQIIAAFKEAKVKGKEIDKEKLISLLIVEYGISKKVAVEEINAVALYDFSQKNL